MSHVDPVIKDRCLLGCNELRPLKAWVLVRVGQHIVLNRRCQPRHRGDEQADRPRCHSERGTDKAGEWLGIIYTYTWYEAKGPIKPKEFARLAAGLFLKGFLADPASRPIEE
jgi:hypothetical protein